MPNIAPRLFSTGWGSSKLFTTPINSGRVAMIKRGRRGLGPDRGWFPSVQNKLARQDETGAPEMMLPSRQRSAEMRKNSLGILGLTLTYMRRRTYMRWPPPHQSHCRPASSDDCRSRHGPTTDVTRRTENLDAKVPLWRALTSVCCTTAAACFQGWQGSDPSSRPQELIGLLVCSTVHRTMNLGRCSLAF